MDFCGLIFPAGHWEKIVRGEQKMAGIAALLAGRVVKK